MLNNRSNIIRELVLKVRDQVGLDTIPEEIIEPIKNSKMGWVSIKKVSDNYGYMYKGESFAGYTYMFGEGLSLNIDGPSNWYYTSVIQNIDWEKGVFKTMNSEYEFEFKPMSLEEVDKNI